MKVLGMLIVETSHPSVTLMAAVISIDTSATVGGDAMSHSSLGMVVHCLLQPATTQS
jgi:hypothetical protein